jgi:hypothetical protein
MKVPTAQWLATNGSVSHTNVRGFHHTPRQQREEGRDEIKGAGRHTNAETTYDTNADSTRDPVQETVPRARNFANTLQVIIRRQSLLVVPIHIERVSEKPIIRGQKRETEGRGGCEK